MKDLSIVIASFNTKELLSNCIKSIISHTQGLIYEIIIVDNASSDRSIETVNKLIKANSNIDIKLLKNLENEGFAKANNKGIRKSQGKYVLLLNSDTLIQDNLLSEITKWMNDHKDVGLVSSSLKNTDGSLQATGGYFPTISRVFFWMFLIDDIPVLNKYIKSFHPHTPGNAIGNNFYLKEKELDWITGAFFFARKVALDDTKLFDERYFMYVEDVDLCYQIKKKGWKIKYLPKWSITHFGGSSGSTEKTTISELVGLKLFYKKYMDSLSNLLLRIFIKTGSFLRLIIYLIFVRFDKVKIYAKAFKIG